MARNPDFVEANNSADRPPYVEMHDVVKIALRVILNHVEPGWENCKSVVEQWLDEVACPKSVDNPIASTLNQEGK